MRASILTLHHVPAGHRVLYTGILLLLVAGHATGLVQQAVRSELSPAGVAVWYRGNADDPDATALLFPKDAVEILDETWRRGLVDLLPSVVLLALLVRASAARPLRRALEAAVIAVALVDLAGPAMVRYGGAGLAWPAFLARVGLLVVAVAVAAVVLRDLWFRGRAGPRFRPAVGSG